MPTKIPQNQPIGRLEELQKRSKELEKEYAKVCRDIEALKQEIAKREPKQRSKEYRVRRYAA